MCGPRSTKFERRLSGPELRGAGRALVNRFPREVQTDTIEIIATARLEALVGGSIANSLVDRDVAIDRLGVIGDIHAQHERLGTALERFRERGVGLVVATGDIADGRGSVDTCCQLLRAHQVVTVRGNHDRWLLAGVARDLPDATALVDVAEDCRTFLAKLPPMVELETIDGTALLCHGLGPNDMSKVTPTDFGYALDSNDELQNLLRNRYYRWVLNGHSHRRMVRAFPGVTIINAGTLNPGHSSGFIEVDFAQRVVLAFEFDDDGRIRTSVTRTALD